MSGYLTGGVLAAMFALQSGSTATQAPVAAKDAAKEIRLSGCIARDRIAPGQFTFLDNEGGGKYRLTGKGLKNFVGHRVEIVGGPPGKRVTFRTGLLPSPNTAAQAGALDPAQAAVANLPGGAADCPLPTAYCRPPTAYCRLPTAPMSIAGGSAIAPPRSSSRRGSAPVHPIEPSG